MLVTVLAFPVVAIAQPSTVDPVALEPVEPAKPRYPRPLAERPLVLPDDAFEVETSFYVRNDKQAFFTPEAKIATSLFELGVGLDYGLSDRGDGPRLAVLHVSGLRQILECRGHQLAVGARFAGNYLFGELPGFAPSLLAHYKRSFRAWFALHASALAGYEYSRAQDETTGWESAQHGLAGTLLARGQLQASKQTAFELRVALAYRQDLGDYTPLGLTSYGSQTLGGMWLYSVGPNADLYLSYDAVLRGGDRAYELIQFGFTVRRI